MVDRPEEQVGLEIVGIEFQHPLPGRARSWIGLEPELRASHHPQRFHFPLRVASLRREQREIARAFLFTRPLDFTPEFLRYDQERLAFRRLELRQEQEDGAVAAVRFACGLQATNERRQDRGRVCLVVLEIAIGLQVERHLVAARSG